MSSFNSGRFANPNRTVDFTFPGGCRCPGAPHDADVAKVRVLIGASAKARIGRAELEGAVRLDPLAAYRQVVLEGVREWNLLWPNPAVEETAEGENDKEAEPVLVPINEGTIELLGDDLVPLAEFIDNIWSGGPDPNGSGAPSRGSSRGSASRIRTRTRTRGT